MHLQLETDVQFVCENPFHDFARIDPAENRRKQNGAATLVQFVALELFARPFVIFTRTDHELHFIAFGQVLDVREKIPVALAAPGLMAPFSIVAPPTVGRLVLALGGLAGRTVP